MYIYIFFYVLCCVYGIPSLSVSFVPALGPLSCGHKLKAPGFSCTSAKQIGGPRVMYDRKTGSARTRLPPTFTPTYAISQLPHRSGCVCEWVFVIVWVCKDIHIHIVAFFDNATPSRDVKQLTKKDHRGFGFQYFPHFFFLISLHCSIILISSVIMKDN